MVHLRNLESTQEARAAQGVTLTLLSFSDWSKFERGVGKFMQHLETCLLISEADRVLCHVVMFLTAFFHWMYKMKYSCYQDPSVIHWFLVEKCTACQSHRKSDFGWHRSV